MTDLPHRPRARSKVRDGALLLVLCVASYFPGLTVHGLTNWQEAMRCLVARQMQERLPTEGVWALVVPTLHGEAYLAKPPAIYWCQLVLAKVTGLLGFGTIDELQLRLTTAIAGVLGVLLTHWLARTLLGNWPMLPLPRGGVAPIGALERENFAKAASWWAALFLAGGVLYVRSSRVGELDILLVPPTLLAVLGVVKSWMHALWTGRTRVTWILVSMVSCVAAALIKGPPALLTIALACYAGPVLWCLCWPMTPQSSPRGGRARAIFWTLSKTHPVGVLGAGAIALWGWSRLVSTRIGDGKLSALVAEEAGDNLRLFVARAPLNNLEAMSFGVGLGSVAALIALVWIARDRRRLIGWITPGWAIVLAWIAGSFVAFSVLGKGVPRYLTPVWPAIAILGGMWFAAAVRDIRAVRRAAPAVAVLAALLAIGQGVWYGYGRERYFASRSPRAMVNELLEGADVDRSRLFAFEFWTPAVDFYAGERVEGILLDASTPRPGLRYVGPMTLADVRAIIGRDGEPATMLIRLTQAPGMAEKTAEECLRDAGFELTPVPLGAHFRTDNDRVEVGAVRLRLKSEALK